MEIASTFNQAMELSRVFGQSKKKLFYTFLAGFNSPHTRQALKNDLKLFFGFLEGYFPTLTENDIERAHMAAFKQYLTSDMNKLGRSYGRRSVNRILASVASFYDFLIEEDLLKSNPVDKIKRFKIERKVTSIALTDEQIRLLLCACDRSNGAGKLHFAILSLFFTTGMRVQEVIDLKVSSLMYVNEKIAIKYISKGGKENVKILTESAKMALGDYLASRANIQGNIQDSEPLFISTRNATRGEPLPFTQKGISYIFQSSAKRGGVKDHIGPHSARATVITKLKSSGMALEDVSDFVGHKDISTTRSYDKSSRNVSSKAINILNL